MTQIDLQTFNQAVSLAQLGLTAQAHSTLKQLAQVYPRDFNLLLWLAYTSEQPATARTYLDQAARLEPVNPALKSAQTWLSTQSSQPQPQSAYPTQSAPALTASALSSGTFSYSQEEPSYRVRNRNQPVTTTLLPSQVSAPTPALPVRKPLNLGLLLVVSFVLVAVTTFVLWVLFSTGIFATDKVAVQGLPISGAITHLDLSGADRDRLKIATQPFAASLKLKSTAHEFYKFNRLDQKKIIEFYDAEFTRLGWTVPPMTTFANSATLTRNYTKDTRVFVLGISDFSTSPLKDFADMKNKVGQDEAVLSAYYGDSAK